MEYCYIMFICRWASDWSVCGVIVIRLWKMLCRFLTHSAYPYDFVDSLMWTVTALTPSHMTSLLINMNVWTSCVYGMWNLMVHLTLVWQHFVTVGVLCIYIYISLPNYFSVNAEFAHCNVVFILSRAVLNVNFMMCETVCSKMFVWCVLLYSYEPSTNIVICREICYEYYCVSLYCTLTPVWSHYHKLCTAHWYQSGHTTTSCKLNIAFH